MEDFIRKLPHDNQIFEDQWPDTFSKIDKLFNEHENKNSDVIGFKVKVLDALVDYILAEPITNIEPSYVKLIFVEKIIKALVENPLPKLADLVRIFRRILDVNDIFNDWHLGCIKHFHYKFKLYEKLSSAKSADLIESIFQSLLKHPFSNKNTKKAIQDNWQEYLSRYMFSQLSMDSNVLNREETMITMRSVYQNFFR